MNIETYEVYIFIDSENRIIRLEGGATIGQVDQETWILIDEGVGDKYYLCQNNYLDKPLFDDNGMPNYKYVNQEIIERTKEEREADIPFSEPTDEDFMIEYLSDLEERLCYLELGVIV